METLHKAGLLVGSDLLSAKVFVSQMKDRQIRTQNDLALTLGTWVNHNWYWFTAFVGTNLLQSGFTKWCLMEDILRKAGVGVTRPSN